jgi:hypothetical protein
MPYMYVRIYDTYGMYIAPRHHHYEARYIYHICMYTYMVYMIEMMTRRDVHSIDVYDIIHDVNNSIIVHHLVHIPSKLGPMVFDHIQVPLIACGTLAKVSALVYKRFMK